MVAQRALEGGLDRRVALRVVLRAGRLRYMPGLKVPPRYDARFRLFLKRDPRANRRGFTAIVSFFEKYKHTRFAQSLKRRRTLLLLLDSSQRVFFSKSSQKSNESPDETTNQRLSRESLKERERGYTLFLCKFWKQDKVDPLSHRRQVVPYSAIGALCAKRERERERD